MSSYGKLNLIGMITLPLVAVLGSILMFGVRMDTQIFVFGTNAAPMLIGGLASALYLRSANKSGNGQMIALWPTLVPAGVGILWYLFGAVSSAPDSGREYFAGPFYLVAGVLIMIVVAGVVGRVARSRS